MFWKRALSIVVGIVGIFGMSCDKSIAGSDMPIRDGMTTTETPLYFRKWETTTDVLAITNRIAFGVYKVSDLLDAGVVFNTAKDVLVEGSDYHSRSTVFGILYYAKSRFLAIRSKISNDQTSALENLMRDLDEKIDAITGLFAEEDIFKPTYFKALTTGDQIKAKHAMMLLKSQLNLPKSPLGSRPYTPAIIQEMEKLSKSISRWAVNQWCTAFRTHMCNELREGGINLRMALTQ